MASTSPIQIIDDDDEFDWEAAVREIDVACDNTKPSASHSTGETSHQVSYSTLTSKTSIKHGTSRQSTLDKFIGTGLKPETRDATNATHQQVESDELELVNDAKIDAHAAKKWIYPVNVPVRDYQFNISRTALFANTLVVLPTGLGKTLIAAVVMYNYFRWFPEGKIVFATPSRPLVIQQIEACHNIVGIPQEWTIDMTGQISPAKRSHFWREKRVFFVTPQVLEKDIRSGSCFVDHLVCLVIDEAHRASGNFAYCVAVRELMAIPAHFRILALTATPGSKQQAVQQVIDNLHISVLEYRNESDHDVIPYVHDRKIELIKVPMGKDAVEINDLLLDVIRTFVGRLSAFGVLPNRDIQNMSPCDLLFSRDKFRQAPPPNLPIAKCKEVEGCFGVLITLCHIRKLLSSHGIRRAFEMLEEKYKQGNFACFMSKNAVLWKAKTLMQQSLCHGDPCPKLSKMSEVLIDHFKTNDPKNSRVIIFSNFRESVRDILIALENVGEIVKATEFIGQSSGKVSKGQSQKVQQAVLEKFRSGQYNVIAATCIGEEGLDIMEVDLVVCFDANVSPLRMIQRMGRTGRKHEGRVVVLAFEGYELRSYKHKQAKCKTLMKHLHNGGMHSFNFHPSPRMIPHIFKPEVELVKFSIEEFIPRGRKVKDDNPTGTPLYAMELTNAETDLIGKYFHPNAEIAREPSLIAFPHFQAFPSRVHKVVHSHRTGMLIDTMQYLQGLSFSRNLNSFSNEDESSSYRCLKVKSIEQNDHNMEDCQTLDNFPDAEPDVLLHVESSKTEEYQWVQDFKNRKCPLHSYLFGSDYVSIHALGEVLVVSVPSIPLEKVSREDQEEIAMQGNDISSIVRGKGNVIIPRLRNSVCEQKQMLEVAEGNLRTPIHVRNFSNKEDDTVETPTVEERKKILSADNIVDDFMDSELSPRLTILANHGIVPQSPIDDTGILNNKYAVLTPALGLVNNSPRGCFSALANVEEIQTPSGNHSNNICSKEWCLSSECRSGNVEQKPKLKRLRRYGDISRRRPLETEEQNIGSTTNFEMLCATATSIQDKHGGGEKKVVGDVRTYIEEEAEVSSEIEVSADEEDGQDNSSYDCSFIDDRIDPTASSAQDEASKIDMMAIYRRSLLSQSPIVRLPSGLTDTSPNSLVPKSQMNESGRPPSSATNDSCSMHQNGIDCSGGNSVVSKLRLETISSDVKLCTNIGSSTEEDKIENRKRKLSFFQAESVPVRNLEHDFRPDFEAEEMDTYPGRLREMEKTEANGWFGFDDDQFYEGIDLDAVEEQAAKLLSYRTESLMQQDKTKSPQPIPPNHGVTGKPFHLRI